MVRVMWSMEKILVVDDEQEIREIMTSMLVAAGYECQQATSGKEALTLFDAGAQFNLVLCDLIMPKLDGIGLLEQIQKRSSGTPFVMLTTIRDISVALAAIRHGAYDYLIKPFDREQLLATVRRALENRRLKLGNRAYQTRLEALVEEAKVQCSAAHDLERSYDITLEALGKALEMKDPELEGHSRRVTAFAVAIARAMGIAPAKKCALLRGGRSCMTSECWRFPRPFCASREGLNLKRSKLSVSTVSTDTGC